MEQDFSQLRGHPSVRITQKRRTFARQHRALLLFVVALFLMIIGYAFFEKFTENPVTNDSHQGLTQYDDISSHLAKNFSEAADQRVENVENTNNILRENLSELEKIISVEMEKIWKHISGVDKQALNMTKRIDALVSAEMEKIWKNISDVNKQALNMTQRIDALEAPNKCRWVWSHSGQIPPGAVVAGNEKNGEKLYIARIHYKGVMVPGKLAHSYQKAFIPWKREINHNEYSVLCNCTPRWLPMMKGGEIPAGAFIAGETTTGGSLYVGRAEHDGSLTPGKVYASGNCLIPFNGEVIAKSNFEIMVF